MTIVTIMTQSRRRNDDRWDNYETVNKSSGGGPARGKWAKWAPLNREPPAVSPAWMMILRVTSAL